MPKSVTIPPASKRGFRISLCARKIKSRSGWAYTSASTYKIRLDVYGRNRKFIRKIESTLSCVRQYPLAFKRWAGSHSFRLRLFLQAIRAHFTRFSHNYTQILFFIATFAVKSLKTDRALHAPAVSYIFLEMKITKNQYLTGLTAVVIMLALVRCIFPDVAKDKLAASAIPSDSISSADTAKTAETAATAERTATDLSGRTRFFNADGSPRKSRIYSVPKFSPTFPDSNNVQLEAAKLHGVSPVENRKDAEARKKELVYISSSPYFHVDRLRSSIPYLVPRAAVLLNDIGRIFYDSLQVKGVPLHQVIVTSVLRSREDIQRLRNYNGNATENSCHLYGTTFDICYNRYKTVSAPTGPERRKVRNDTLKWVLSEVLRDMREKGRCYIKYEVKQGCFHITTR